MRGFLSSITRIGLSGLGSALLVTNIMAIATIGLSMAGLYVFKYAQVTTEMRQFQCYVLGTQHPDCNDYQQELDDLAAERAALAAELAKLKQRFSNLEAIERSIDTINLFEHKPLQDSTLKLTVGTVYNTVTDGSSGYQSYFCYIKFVGSIHFDRNLYLRNHNGDVAVDSATLSKNNISAAAYASAREQCQPMLIGG